MAKHLRHWVGVGLRSGAGTTPYLPVPKSDNTMAISKADNAPSSMGRPRSLERETMADRLSDGLYGHYYDTLRKPCFVYKLLIIIETMVGKVHMHKV